MLFNIWYLLILISGHLVHLVTLDVSHNNIGSIPRGKCFFLSILELNINNSIRCWLKLRNKWVIKVTAYFNQCRRSKQHSASGLEIYAPLFQKISIPPIEGFVPVVVWIPQCFQKFQFSVILSFLIKTFAFVTPLPLGISTNLPWDGYFWNCTIKAYKIGYQTIPIFFFCTIFNLFLSYQIQGAKRRCLWLFAMMFNFSETYRTFLK